MSVQAKDGARTRTMLAAAVLTACHLANAQKVTSVPSLDPSRLTGTWYEVSRYPTKLEDRCAAQATVLFAESDQPRSIQMGSFCPGKNGSEQEYTDIGRLDKHGDGKIKFGLIWPFTRKYWILALAPDYSWILAGQPNRKVLSILARTPQLDPTILTSIGAQAQAQGFTLSKLVSLPKQGMTYKALDNQLKVTPPAPATAKP